MRCLILHGWQGSGPDHWQTWLAGRLGEEASYPELPEPFTPHLADWLDVLDAELERRPDAVVCHSLACVLWLHHAGRSAGRPVERVLLVAPPSESVNCDDLHGFFPLSVASSDVAHAAASTRLVCSENDPYCPECAARVYGEPLGIETQLIAGAGHINPEAGYGPWPDVERWLLDAR